MNLARMPQKKRQGLPMEIVRERSRSYSTSLLLRLIYDDLGELLLFDLEFPTLSKMRVQNT